MSRPTQSDVHVDRPLSNILIAYMQDASGFVAQRACPNVPVQFKTDKYYLWDRKDFFRVEIQKERAPGAPAEVGGIELTTATYEAKEYAVAYDLIDSIVDNADAELNLEQAATEYIGQQLLLKRESVFNSTFLTTSTWTGSSTGSDLTGVAGTPGSGQFKQWNDASSTPIEDIRTQIVAIAEKTGYRPNKLILGAEVWKALVDHPDILDRIKYTQRGVVTMDLVASLLELDQILVSWGTRNTAKEGVTAAYDFFQGKTALLWYVPPRPSVLAPSAAYTFTWTRRFAGPQGERIKRFRMEDREAWRIEGQQNYAMKVVAAELGAYFTSAVA